MSIAKLSSKIVDFAVNLRFRRQNVATSIWEVRYPEREVEKRYSAKNPIAKVPGPAA
jgi:hypothetical protein